MATQAEDDPLKVGDVVYVRSGSPRMTIIGIDTDVDPVAAKVMWMEYRGNEIFYADVPLASLKRT